MRNCQSMWHKLMWWCNDLDDGGKDVKIIVLCQSVHCQEVIKQTMKLSVNLDLIKSSCFTMQMFYHENTISVAILVDEQFSSKTCATKDKPTIDMFHD